jgi:hypothetical protein
LNTLISEFVVLDNPLKRPLEDEDKDEGQENEKNIPAITETVQEREWTKWS